MNGRNTERRHMEEFLRRASQQMEHAINAGYKLEKIGFSMWAERSDKIPFTVEFEFDYSGVNHSGETDSGGDPSGEGSTG